MLLAIRFKVEGSLRFLSHAETLKVFQRACVRAGIRIRYSEGFNPRPRLSLPLPRSVGVESDDELLCVRLKCDPAAEGTTGEPEGGWQSRIKQALGAQLPEGCKLLSIGLAPEGASFQPCSATYVLPVQPEYFSDELHVAVERVLASECLPFRRPMDKNGLKFKNVDVRGFLKSIKPVDGRIIAECEIRPEGSVRVDELLKLLGLDESMLASPVRRTNVQWQSN
jgi:radical SAM-linked protein